MATPAQIVRQYLIDLAVIDGSSDQTKNWPSGIGQMPVQGNISDQYVTFIDTGSSQTGRRNNRTGDRNERPTVQIMTRGDYASARAKLIEINLALNSVGVLTTEGGAGAVPVQVGTEVFVLRVVTVTGDPLYLGQQQQKKLELFSSNIRVLYDEDTPEVPARYPFASVAAEDDLLGYDLTTGLLSRFGVQSLLNLMPALPTSPTFADVTADRLFLTPGGRIQVGNGSAFLFSGSDLSISGQMTANRFEGSADGLTDLPWVPSRVFYASRIPGVFLDADPDNNTGTDNTDAIMAVIVGGDVHLIIDGPCMIDTLLLASYTILECTGDGFLFRKGQPNGGRNCIMNANPVMGPSEPTDKFIVLRNVRLDGNRRNNGSGNTGTGPFNTAFDQAVMNDDGHGVVGIGFFGVRNLTILDVEVTDPPAYGLQLANVRHGRIKSFGKYRRVGDTIPTDTIFQVQGWCDDIEAEGLYGTALDDAMALNANDGQDDAGATTGPEPGLVAPGPINKVTLRGCKFEGVMQVCRFLSANQANPITNVLIEDVDATLGLEGQFAFAGFFIDDFGLTGPLIDGTHGFVDGVRIINVNLIGNTTGPPYGTVHFGNCRFGRFLIQNLRSKTNSSPVANVVTVAAGATGDTLILDRVVNESLIAGVPSIAIKGPVRSVTVDGCEFDQHVAGSNLPLAWTNNPNQSFYPTCLVRVEAAVDNLFVHGTRTAGVSEVVRIVGTAPKAVIIGGLTHVAEKGGAILRSNVVLPNVLLYGLPAGGQPTEVPAGSVVTNLGTDFVPVSVTNLRADFFESNTGTQYATGTALQSTVSENGVAWNLPLAGTGNVRITNTGTVFGDAPCIIPVDTPGRPTTDTFDVWFDIVRKSAVAAGDWVYLQLFSDVSGVSDFAGFCFDSTTLSIRQNNATVVQTISLVPAVGVVWRIWCRVTAVGNVRTIKTFVSTDAGRTWAPLLADAVFTIAQPKTLAIYTLGTSASATTGNHVGGIVVRSYSAAPQVMPTAANPTGTVGLAAVNGTAASFMRSDAAPALSQAITPVWTGQHVFNSALPTVFRQNGGAAGADELQVSYSSTGALIESKGTAAGQFMTFKLPDSKNFVFLGGGNGTKVIFQTDGSTQVRLQKGALDFGSDGLIGWTATAGNGNLSNDTTIGRLAGGVVVRGVNVGAFYVNDSSNGNNYFLVQYNGVVIPPGMTGSVTAGNGLTLGLTSGNNVSLVGIANGIAAFNYWNGAALVPGWLQATPGRKIKAADQTVTDTTTLANDTHLQVTLLARKYTFRGKLYVTTTATSGIKIDFGNSTATVTNFIASAKFFFSVAGSGMAVARSAALATAMGVTTVSGATVVEVDFSGTFEVNVAGTFGLRFAQNAETGAAESVVSLRGGYMLVEDMP